MKVACIQPKLNNSIKRSYEEIENLLKLLFKEFDDCELVCLPERWIPFFNQFYKNFQEERGRNYNFIKKMAGEYGVNFISGAIWEKRSDQAKPFITSYYFNPLGEEIGRQDKLHLYSYERNQFQAGDTLKIFTLQDYSFSILICFDMAFYETPRLAAEHGADILISPTQIREEGLYNWNIYLQARALENKIPVVACNTVGTIEIREIRRFLGKSKIISFKEGPITPSKLIVKEASTENGFIFDDLDLDFPRKLRNIRLNEKINESSIRIKKVN